MKRNAKYFLLKSFQEKSVGLKLQKNINEFGDKNLLLILNLFFFI